MEGWIGVDLDGTLAEYDEWRGLYHIGKPIEPMVERVKTWLDEGKKVKVFTARASIGPDKTLHQVDKQVKVIMDWCEEHIGQPLEVTCIKDYGCREIWDDRAVAVAKNNGSCFSFNNFFWFNCTRK